MTKELDNRTLNLLDDLNSIAQETKRFGTKEYGADPGKRYDRVWWRTPGHKVESVKCFVDRTTGDILYANGWKAPAKWKSGPATEFHTDESRLYAEFTRDGGWGYRGDRAAWEGGVFN